MGAATSMGNVWGGTLSHDECIRVESGKTRNTSKNVAAGSSLTEKVKLSFVFVLTRIQLGRGHE